MSFQFNVTSKEFFTEYRNGTTFADNLTEVTEILQCNVGDRNKLAESISVTTIINPDETLNIAYDPTSDVTNGQFTAEGFDFKINGLFVGASVDVTQGSTVMDCTIASITGPGNTLMTLTKANLTPLTAGEYSDLQIKIKTAPTYLTYNYGINALLTTANTYDSEFDDNVQGYYAFGITTSPATMTRLGADVSWDLTESLTIEFIDTTDDYTHNFELVHIFSIRYYLADEVLSILLNTKPSYLAGDNSVKYVNGFFFGGVGSEEALKFEDEGSSGNVGWFNESLNGYDNDFSVTALTITNSSATATLEVTETNSVQYTLNSANSVFTTGSKVIVAHSKLSNDADYANSPDTNAVVFVRETLATLASATAVSGTMITNFDVTYISAAELTVDFDITFSAAQQLLLSDGNRFILWATIGDESLSALLEVPVNIFHVDIYSKNSDEAGLITAWQPYYRDANATYAGARKHTDLKGWDGDLVGFKGTFNLAQSLLGEYRKISSINSVIIATDGTTEFPIHSTSIDMAGVTLIEGGGYTYTALSSVSVVSPRFPADEELNLKKSVSLPPFSGSTQSWAIQGIFPRITWRPWIANLDVDSVFFDAAEDQNNQNKKTSNYSGVSSYEIYHQLEVTVATIEIDPAKFGAVPPTTLYKLRSDQFDILDFDDAGGSSFSATTKYYGENGDEVTNLLIDQVVRIEIEFAHTLGTLLKLDTWGMIWLGRQGGSSEPYQLHTDKDWTSEDNPLEASDTLVAGNTQYVEFVTAANLVTLKCNTVPELIDDGVIYNVYGRLGKKT